MNSREAAFLALLASLRLETFVSDYLDQWQKHEKPTPRDFGLAYEIASGSARMALALDYIAANLSEKKKLSLKLKERALVRTAIYQHCFMSRIPLYAIVDETMEIAKKHCHPIFNKYLHALLRALEKGVPSLPSEKTPQAFSVSYSYPIYFVEELLEEHGILKTEEILAAGNQSPIIMARKMGRTFGEMEIVEDLQKVANSPEYYIQNSTPVELMEELAEQTSLPGRILDLCASPGGKALMLRDLFPQAKLFVNDVSEEKLRRLKENFAKYGVEAHLSCGLGEDYLSDELFDLIVLDVPCSNSGVLNKRPEARWRINPEALKALNASQMRLLKRAKELLAPGGKIWYLTCSILPEENELLIKEACQTYRLEAGKHKRVLPTKAGSDGGFACLLIHSIS